MADAKTEVMQQVRQQAAIQNARLLVEVRNSLRPTQTTYSAQSLTMYLLHYRSSTSTASSAASPLPAPLSPPASRPAIPTASRSTCRRGTPLAGSTWATCRRVLVRRCKFRAEGKNWMNGKADGCTLIDWPLACIDGNSGCTIMSVGSLHRENHVEEDLYDMERSGLEGGL